MSFREWKSWFVTGGGRCSDEFHLFPGLQYMQATVKALHAPVAHIRRVLFICEE